MRKMSRSGTMMELKRPLNPLPNHASAIGSNMHSNKPSMVRSRSRSSFHAGRDEDDNMSVASFDDTASVVSSMASFVMDAEDVRSSNSSTFETLVLIFLFISFLALIEYFVKKKKKKKIVILLRTRVNTPRA